MELKTFVKLPIIHNTPDSAKMVELNIPVKDDMFIVRDITFFRIDTLSAYFSENNPMAKSIITVGGVDFLCTLTEKFVMETILRKQGR